MTGDPCKLCGSTESVTLFIESVEPPAGYPLCFWCAFERSGSKAAWDKAVAEDREARGRRVLRALKDIGLEAGDGSDL